MVPLAVTVPQSVLDTVMVYVPDSVGVPLINPVAELKVKPAGRLEADAVPFSQMKWIALIGEPAHTVWFLLPGSVIAGNCVTVRLTEPLAVAVHDTPFTSLVAVAVM